MLAKQAYAVCPVCVVAVGGGLWLAKVLGIDDLIASIWIGALTTTIAIASGPRFKWIKLPFPEFFWTIIFYTLSLVFLGLQGILNSPYCKIWGVCRIWLGITIGTIVIWVGYTLDKFLRTKNADGKAFFPFQKVVVPLALTLITSLIFYLLIC